MPDLIYNRPIHRKKYISIHKHQRNTHNTYSKWVSINVEKDIFDYADFGNLKKSENPNDNLNMISWTCVSGNMWGLQHDYSDVGTEKQQFGFFVRPVNINDEWHGYPMIPFSNSLYFISDELLIAWAENNIITVDDIPMIKAKKRI